MYPLPDGMFAPRNQWYVAAMADEIGREPMERWILDEPVAFYRKQDGTAVALDGRCPHRSFPLGKSLVVDDDIQCAYHGIRFGADGQATMIPSQDNVPRVCRVKSYPVAERWKWVWIWPGDPDLADESLIPDHEMLGLTDPGIRMQLVDYHEVAGRYTLLHDNLMDLTHIQFLHRDSFGAGTKSDQVPGHSEGANWVASHFEQLGIDVPPLLKPILKRDGPVDRLFGLRFLAPCLHFGADDVFEVNADGSRGECIGAVRIIHAVTPATKTSCHYWNAVGHSWMHMPPEFDKAFTSKIAPGLEEDVYATVEIEKMIDHKHGRPGEILLRADHVAVRGRRILEKIIRAEQQASAPDVAGATGHPEMINLGVPVEQAA